MTGPRPWRRLRRQTTPVAGPAPQPAPSGELAEALLALVGDPSTLTTDHADQVQRLLAAATELEAARAGLAEAVGHPPMPAWGLVPVSDTLGEILLLDGVVRRTAGTAAGVFWRLAESMSWRSNPRRVAYVVGVLPVEELSASARSTVEDLVAGYGTWAERATDLAAQVHAAALAEYHAEMAARLASWDAEQEAAEEQEERERAEEERAAAEEERLERERAAALVVPPAVTSHLTAARDLL